MLPPAESIQILLPIASILMLMMGFIRPVYGTIGFFIVLNAKLGMMYPTLGAIRFELLSAIVAVAAILVSGRGIGHVFPRSSALNKPFWILSVVCLISVVQAFNVQFSWEYGGYDYIRMMIFYFMVVASIRDRGDLTRLLWAFVLVTAWVAYEPIVNYLNGIMGVRTYGSLSYAVGTYGAAAGHVALANTICQALPVAIFMALSEPGRNRKLLLYLLIAFLVVGIVFSKSRGGFVGLVTVVLGMVYFSPNRAKAMVLAGVMGVVLIVLSGGAYLSHMASITKGIHQSRSTYDRYLGLRHGIEMLTKRPIMGVGIGCYPEARSQYFGYFFYSHNLYGEVIGELGLFSFFWFYWIYKIFKQTNLWRKHLEQKENPDLFYVNMLKAIQLSLALRLMIGNFTHSAFIWFWFLMAGLTVGMELLLEEEETQEEAARAEVPHPGGLAISR